jgi:hypothetical protein
MDKSLVNLTEQIAFLNPKNLEELQLFVEFLLQKQQKTAKTPPKRSKKIVLLADMYPIVIPVSDYIIQREDIYENRI